MSIVVNSLAHTFSDGKVLFTNINFSVQKGEKIALVGPNGIGKSTLLRIIAGVKEQYKGEIILPEKPYYIPQHLDQLNGYSIQEVLRVDKKIAALHEILKGNVTNHNLETLNDDWEIEEKVRSALRHWNLDNLSLSQETASLSGGEKAKISLSGILIHAPKIILLDEPTNHLDYQSRLILYDFIQTSKSTILIVSHDRELLNLLDKIIELTPNSTEVYGGNYDFYYEQKKIKIEALQSSLVEKEKSFNQIRQKSRELNEKRQKLEVRGKTQKAKAGIPRISMGRLRNNAEQSSVQINSKQNDKMDSISSGINAVKEQIQKEQPLKILIQKSGLHHGKILVKADEINIEYHQEPLWKEGKSFTLLSGDRVLIKGNNGSGKTSLVKAIMGKQGISSGSLYMADFNHLYIDQEYSEINNLLTVFEQCLTYNTQNLAEHEIKKLLHRHQFVQEYWDRQCMYLSGGEKMKLLLCCLIISNNSPDVLILDEPTNNLDIYSLDTLTQAIRDFEGTILLISHDSYFIKETNITKTFCL